MKDQLPSTPAQYSGATRVRPRPSASLAMLAMAIVLLGKTISAAAAETPPAAMFRKHGTPIDEWDPPIKASLLKRYRAALAAFPDADSCLLPHDGDAIEARIDWERIRSTLQLEICLFWIAADLGDPTRMEAWLSDNAFRTDGARVVPKVVMRKMGSAEPGILLGAGIAGRDIPRPLLPWGSFLIPPHSLSVGIQFYGSGQPVDVFAGFNYE